MPLNGLKQPTYTACGQDCGSCGCLGDLCPGCEAAGGRIFHSPEGCPICRCVRGEKGLRHCGVCGEIPCRIWRDTRAPALSDKAFAADIRQRVENLKRRPDGRA